MIIDVSLTSNKALVKSFVEEVFDKHNISAIEKYLGESQAFEGFLSNFFNAFPDWHANIEHMIAEDDYVMVFLKGTGKHLGEYQGKPATNETVNIRSADLYKIENNKIIGHWDVVDQQNLVQQTGFQL